MLDWDADMRGHQDAIAQVAAAARSAPEARWTVPPTAGKWSPADVMMHLILTYEFLAREQRGDAAIPLKVPRWKAWMLRRFILPRLLAGRPIPPGVRSPREVRPVGDRLAAAEAVKRLETIAAEWEQAMTANHANPAARSVHPMFGALSLPTMLRFVALHTRHHCRQLERAAAGLTMHGT
ncbi:MAG: DinB family protein [Gemmatimonadota bacterium]|nr:DinB family protein [Gemmatimonadota bacterium]